ncbi:MAG: pitrilysin family protein [Rubrivivax sp.]
MAATRATSRISSGRSADTRTVGTEDGLSFSGADTTVHALPNGVRLVTIECPHLCTANVSVFVRAGSQHESRRLAGISHVVEHMAFKGTASRSCQRINLDAERLGAEVNAHTDKDHTAFHIDGLAQDAPAFVRMLADIVRNGIFPADELERERQVILHELADDEDDAVATGFKLFDRVCWSSHPMGRAVIGTRRTIEAFTRNDLLAHVQRHYRGGNVVVGVAGAINPKAIQTVVQDAFGSMVEGVTPAVVAPAWHGGLKTRRLAGSHQTHVVLGWQIPSATDAPEAAMLAAALFGEGMSSPLIDELREKRALAYHVGCSADVNGLCGQFVIEASTGPKQVEEFLTQVQRLLQQHAAKVDRIGLQRARNQLAVRALRGLERPGWRLEAAALDLYTHGSVRTAQEKQARLQAVTGTQVRRALQRMIDTPAALALTGRVGAGALQAGRALAGGEP